MRQSFDAAVGAREGRCLIWGAGEDRSAVELGLKEFIASVPSAGTLTIALRLIESKLDCLP